MTLNCFKYSAGACLLLALSLSACRKPEINKPAPASAFSATAQANLQIDLSDVVEKLPQTILYNYNDQVRFYVERAQWKYTDEGLVVRIPTTEGDDKFIYASKSYADHENTNVYAVQFVRDTTIADTLFSGRELWIDFQNWTAYGIEYRKNTEVARMSPQVVAPVDWESQTIDYHHFYLDDNGHLQVIEDCDVAHGPSTAWGSVSTPKCRQLFSGVFRFFEPINPGA